MNVAFYLILLIFPSPAPLYCLTHHMIPVNLKV